MANILGQIASGHASASSHPADGDGGGSVSLKPWDTAAWSPAAASRLSVSASVCSQQGRPARVSQRLTFGCRCFFACFELFGCEVFVSEAFVLHVLDNEFHLVYRVISADVVHCCELFRIAG